jgi:hypothetical protein
MAIAADDVMRILEARFHPFERESPTFVVVGHVVWDDATRAPRVEPAAALARQTAPSTMLATLKHLVQMTTPGTFERLQALRSRFWSFVSVQRPAQEAKT